jgi:hypothetical protein
LGQHLAQARAKAEQALLDYNPDQLLLASETDVVDYLIGLGTIEELVLHREEAYQLDSPAEITKWVHDRWDRQKHQRRVTRYTVVVPFSGDPKLFDLRASTFGLAPPYAYVGRQEIHLFWDSDYGHGTAEVIKSHIGEELTRIETSVGFTNNDIARHNKTTNRSKLTWGFRSRLGATPQPIPFRSPERRSSQPGHRRSADRPTPPSPPWAKPNTNRR